MMNRQIEEALHSAKVFVLQAVDEVTFKTRRFFDGDAMTDRGSMPAREARSSVNGGAQATFQSNEDVPTEGAPDEDAEVWLDVSEPTPPESDWGPDELTARPSEIGPSVDEELFLAAAGEMDEEPFDDDADLPAVRPSRDSLGEGMARAMLINASGGSSDDEPVDDVDPLDRIAVELEP